MANIVSNQSRSRARSIGRSLTLALLACIALLPAGCGYTLRGKVIPGNVSHIEVVHQSDPRLKQPGLTNVEIMVRRDPNTPNQMLAAHDRTDPTGTFSTSVKGFGAGWMEELWLIQAMLHGHQNAETMIKLPQNNPKWRVLITLAPGPSTPLSDDDDPEDLMKEAERYR